MSGAVPVEARIVGAIRMPADQADGQRDGDHAAVAPVEHRRDADRVLDQVEADRGERGRRSDDDHEQPMPPGSILRVSTTMIGQCQR